MPSRLVTHRCVRWMAIVAVWFAALAPTVSHALRGPAAAALAEICTVAGFSLATVTNDAAADEQPAPAHAAGDFTHCPFCLLQGHASALPSQPPALPMPAGLRFAVPRLFLQAAYTPHAWAPAQARAPPVKT